MSLFLQLLFNGLTVGSFYALTALGYTMIYGIIRLINFAHGDLLMVGAFIGWTLLTTVAIQHIPIAAAIAVALLLSMAATGILGLVVDRFAYEPLLRGSRLSILITALGVSLALENGVQLGYGAGFKAYPHLLPSVYLPVGGASLGVTQIGIFALSLALMLGLYLFVHRTAIGTAMRALALDQDAARLMGIDVEGVIRLTFFIGSALAAAAGVMMGLYYSEISFTMGFLLGIRAFTAAVIGGIGNIPGAMVGGMVIGLLEAFTAGYFSSRWSDVAVFGALILMLMFRPRGIFGERVVERM
ncbi:MAG TPA: branched-chain amino acid ABC transporter permease [Stellaceae bacterium]|nr:branched-chain amino acid ABC transporter permease [Stellaceae bacterium]